MKITRSDAIAMMFHCGYRDFWPNDKFADKLQSLPDVYRPTEKPCEDARVRNLLEVCVDHVRGGGVFTVVDDEPGTVVTVADGTNTESPEVGNTESPEVGNTDVVADDKPAPKRRLKTPKGEKKAKAKKEKKAKEPKAKKEKKAKEPKEKKERKRTVERVRDVRDGVFYTSGAIIKEFGHGKGISDELLAKFRALRGKTTKHDIVNYLTRSWHIINGFLHGYTEAQEAAYAEFVKAAEEAAAKLPPPEPEAPVDSTKATESSPGEQAAESKPVEKPSEAASEPQQVAEGSDVKESEPVAAAAT